VSSVNVVVHRTEFGSTYVLGDLLVNGQRIGRTLEYPWRGNTKWNADKSKGANFRHTSCIREGVYTAVLRGGHISSAGSMAGRVQWRLELEGVANRSAIEFHVGNTLIHDSEGCILCGDVVLHTKGVEPQLKGSNNAVDRFVSAIFGDVSNVRNASQWAGMMNDLRITVRVIGMPPGAWKVS